MDGDLTGANAGQAVTLTLDREIDISRGECSPVRARRRNFPTSSRPARLDGRGAGLPGRSYLLKIGAQTVPASITDLKTRSTSTRSNTAPPGPRAQRGRRASPSRPTPYRLRAYAANRPHRRLHPHRPDLTTPRSAPASSNSACGAHRTSRTRISTSTAKCAPDRRGRSPRSSGSPGCPARASRPSPTVEKRLTAEGRHAYILDGDNVRHGLNKDLGFTEDARVENIRRVAEVARLMADAGLIVLVSFISPFRNERRLAREIAGDIQFTEVYVDTRLKSARRAIPRGSTPRPAAARSRTSPASIALRGARKTRYRPARRQHTPEQMADELCALTSAGERGLHDIVAGTPAQ